MATKHDIEIKHLKGLIKQLRELMDLRDRLNQESVKLALTSINERMAGMNEFRAQQRDMIAGFATQEKLESEISKTNLRIDMLIIELNSLKEWRSNEQGRRAIIQYLYPIIITILGYLASKYIH